MKFFLYAFIFVSLYYWSYSQKEANNWYFGHGAGITFNTLDGSPIALTDGELDTREGCASISDRNGVLLFYTDGIYVWNRRHKVMPNGKFLTGHRSSTQSALIVPCPNNNKLFYIFTVDSENGIRNGRHKGFRYSIVDMSLDNGLGDVTLEKNVFIFQKTTEKLTAVKHANGEDIWIIIHEYDSDAFLSYLITKEGIKSNTIISNIGQIHKYNDLQGYMKVSPDGEKLAIAITGWSFSLTELFDFNDETGIISNTIFLDSINKNSYGLEFSPDCTKLYASAFTSSYTDTFRIFQFDLLAGNPNEIKNSVTLISNGGTKRDRIYAALQLGPDGKIYVAKGDTNKYLGVINYPNKLGLACNYVEKGVFLEKGGSKIGLPNYISSYFKEGVHVWLPDVEARIGGKNLCIPLTVKAKCEHSIDISISYKIEIQFDARFFAPYPNDKIKSRIANGMRILTIEGDTILTPYKEILLTEICGDVLLGDSSEAPLTITSVILSDSLCGVERLDGSLKISGLCQPGISRVRSFIPTEARINPNPAVDNVEVIIETEESGRFSLDVYSIEGIKLNSKQWFKSEKTYENLSVNINLKNYSSGVYYITLRTQYNYLTRQLYVMK